MFSHSLRAIARPFVAAFVFAPLLLPVVVRAEETGSLACPVLGTKIDTVAKDTLFSDYKGARYYFCCGACKPQFDKDQDKVLKDSKNKDKVLAVSLFDPVITKRLDPDKATAHKDAGK